MRSQTFFSGAQQQNHGEWSQAETQEAPSERRKDATVKHFFTLRLTDHWHQAAQRGYGVSPLEHIVDLVLGNWVLVTLLKQEHGPDDLWRHPKTSNFCGSAILLLCVCTSIHVPT